MAERTGWIVEQTCTYSEEILMGIAFSTLDRPQYYAKRMVKPINFFFLGPEAESVCLMGDFNGWNPTSHPMHCRKDGWWSLQVPLNHGHHQ